MARKKALTEADRQIQAVKQSADAHESRFGRACYADGGSVGGLAGKRERVIDAAEQAAVRPAAAPAPAPAAEPTEQEKAKSVGISIPAAPAPAPAPKKKGLFGLGVMGLADGGLLGDNTTAQVDAYRTSLNQAIANRTGIATGGATPTVQPAAPPLAQPNPVTAPAAPVSAPAPTTPAPARPSSSGWNYQNGRIALAHGGPVRGPGGPVDDKVPAMLSAGEYVLPADTVQAVGKENLDELKDATHTPAVVQRARFGAATPDAVDGMGLADGGLTAEEILRRMQQGGVETIDYSKVPQPSAAQPAASAPVRPSGPIEPRFTPNADGTMNPKQAAFQQAQMRSAAPTILEEATGGASKAAAAEGNSVLGRAANVVKSVTSPVTKAVGAVTGPVGTVARVAAGPIGAGVMAATHSAEAGAGSDVLRDPNTGAVTNAGNAPTITPQAQAMSSQERYRLLNIINTSKDPGAVAQARQQLIGDGSQQSFGSPADKYSLNPVATPAEAATKPAQSAAPDTGNPTQDATNAAMAADAARDAALERAGVPRTALGQTAVPDAMRGDIVRNARPAPGAAVDLGDYGSDGTRVFGMASKPGGKIDTFAGAGGGSNKATGYAPAGVTFGITPEMLARDRAQRDFQRAVGDAPQFQAPQMTREHQQAISTLNDLQKQLSRATSRPERNQINEQIQAQRAIVAAHNDMFGQQSQTAAHTFGSATSAYNNRLSAYTTQQGNAASAINSAAQREFDWAKFQLGRQDEATARAATTEQKAYDRNRQNYADLKDKALNAAAAMGGTPEEQKQLAGGLETFLTNATVKTKDGRELRFHELNPVGQRKMLGQAMANAIITRELNNAGALQSTPSARLGTPYNVQAMSKGPELWALMNQGKFGPIDAFRDGIQIQGVRIPWNRFPSEAQEELKAQLGQK